MVIQAQRVLNDWFEISRVAHIPYKVFIPTVSKDEHIQILKTATALRYEDSAVLCYQRGRELWLFGNQEPPRDPHPRFNLTLSHKGTILPSSAGLPLSSDTPRPWNYLAAVRNAAIAHMIQAQNLLPFGDSLYDPKSGCLTHIVPGITVQGHLHLRLTNEAANLRRVTSKETPLVWLIPFGRQARLVDTFSAPSPTLSQQFAEVLHDLCYISLPPINEGIWVQVSYEGQDFLWPQSLVVTSQQSPENLSWLRYIDNATRITEQTAEMAAPSPNQTPGQVGTPATHHHHLMATLPSVYMPPPLPPPPPTPSATVIAPSEGVYPTPNDNSPEPNAPATNEEWPTAEWEEEENNEVTVADFNFFDVPTTAPEKPAKPESDTSSPHPPSTKTIQLPRHLEYSPKKTVGGAFAPLDFNSSLNMDSKYLVGGRYFTSNEEAEEQDEEGPNKEISALNASSGDSMDELETDSDVSMADEDDDVAIPDPWSFSVEAETSEQPSMVKDDDRAGDPRTYFSISRQRAIDASIFTVENNDRPWLVEAWVNALTVAPKPAPTDHISDESIQALMEQVVWDNGQLNFSDAYGPRYGICSPAKPLFVNSLKAIFPAIRRLSLADMCLNSSALSAPTPSHLLSPVIPGADTVAKPASPQAAPRDEELHFTLLSPPLYSIHRMNQSHKARAAILRFWKVFGLQPGGGKRDFVLVSMVLSSKIRSPIREQVLAYMKSIYEGCELGTITIPTVGPVKNGHMEINANLDYLNPDTLGDLYENSCSVLKRSLAEEFPPETKVIVLMSWPTTHRASPIPLTRGYLALKSGFPNLRWQLYSTEYSWLYPDELGTISQYWYSKIALMWYDRWVGRTEPGLEPAFKLARLVPHSINLRYDEQPSTHIFDTDPTMHVAYAITSDRRWVAVSWSDQWASCTRVKVYRLNGDSQTVANSPAVDGGVQINRAEDRLPSVFKEIWLETATVCGQCPKSSATCQWRIALIKCGPIDATEVDIWAKIQAKIVWPTVSCLNLLSIPRFSPLHVYDGEMLFPHVGMGSNDQTVCPPDPSSEDPQKKKRVDNVIVSAIDETHGIVFENKLYDLVNNATVLAAGVFIKPLNPPSFFGNQQLEVCLVHGQKVSKNSMKQILGQFRRLSSLGETTGVSADVTILPWHVEAAQKMVRALSLI